MDAPLSSGTYDKITDMHAKIHDKHYYESTVWYLNNHDDFDPFVRWNDKCRREAQLHCRIFERALLLCQSNVNIYNFKSCVWILISKQNILALVFHSNVICWANEWSSYLNFHIFFWYGGSNLQELVIFTFERQMHQMALSLEHSVLITLHWAPRTNDVGVKRKTIFSLKSISSSPLFSKLHQA